MARTVLAVALLIVGGTLPLFAWIDVPAEKLGSASEFRIETSDGKSVELTRKSSSQLTVVCFLGTECPLARYYGPRLSELAARYASRGVTFIGLNSNLQDSPEEVAQYAREYGVTFPIAKDRDNQLADQFGARRMAEVFVVDQNLQVRYRGRIDDQYQPGVARGKATRDDLRIALDELLAGKPVTVPHTETTGCLIGRVARPSETAEETPSVTFCRDVSRVLNQHCVECHRPGEIGPFSLTDYDEVTGWGATIQETVDAGRMPPWNANPKHGSFQNARAMPESDKQILRDWIAAGMPYGKSEELPPPPKFATGWQLPRTPDLVLPMRERPYAVPATGTVEYQYFVVDPHFEEDRWVSASQVIPGSRSVVHHVIVFIRPPDGSDVRGVGYLTGYVPGQRSFSFPPGYARRVPAGSKFVFQMHYTPTGIAQTDISRVGMTFIPESEVTHEVFTLLGIDQEFEIPPHAADYPVQGQVGWIPHQAELLAITPHMHVRGKAFQAVSRSGDQAQVLLDVPRYDFNWQHVYEFTQPLKLADIDQLEFTARFDNSRGNPVNPDPSQTVTWGDQTWEEMAVAFFEVAEPRHGPSEPEPQRNKRRLIMREAKAEAPATSVDDFVTDFFKRFDQNGDSVVEKHETPLAFRTYGFRRYDQDGDGKLSVAEIREAASRQRR